MAWFDAQGVTDAFAATVALHALFGAVMLMRQGQALDLATVAQVALAVGTVIGVRTVAMAVVGRALGLRLRYRAWETGMTLAGAIAVAFAVPFLAPGVQPFVRRRWTYRTTAIDATNSTVASRPLRSNI